MRIDKYLAALLLMFAAGAAAGCDAPENVATPSRPSLEVRLEALKKNQSAPAVNAAPIPPLISRAVPPSDKQQRPIPKPKDVFEPSGVTVQIFVEEWSPYCKELESFLIQHRIKYIKYDISKDQSAKMYVKQLTGNYSVPVSLVGKTVIRGLDLAALKMAVRKVSPNGDKMRDYRF